MQMYRGFLRVSATGVAVLKITGRCRDLGRENIPLRGTGCLDISLKDRDRLFTYSFSLFLRVFFLHSAQIRCLPFDGIGVRHLGIGALADSSVSLE